MRVLREGMSGEDVRAWEYFLAGLDLYQIDVDGNFDTNTKSATQDFQRRHALGDDGVVGRSTLGAALSEGFDPLEDQNTDEDSANWPARPSNLYPLASNVERAATWGRFAFKASTPGVAGSAITITDGWAQKNIVNIEIPQLAGVTGAPARVPFHKDVAESVKKLFDAWEEAGHRLLIRTWAGSWAPRFIRGSTVSLSNHSWATAFDINVAWNGLGAQPALVGKTGSVRVLAPIAAELGWFWGGWFPRKDGMHFEATAAVL